MAVVHSPRPDMYMVYVQWTLLHAIKFPKKFPVVPDLFHVI